MKRTGKSGWLRRASALLLLLALALNGCAAPAEKTQAEKTAAYLMDTVTEPSCGSVGGEWAVIGLARAGCAVKDGYFEGYYDRLCETLRACGGVLDARKNTEYSRVILALTAIGKDPRPCARRWHRARFAHTSWRRARHRKINASLANRSQYARAQIALCERRGE